MSTSDSQREVAPRTHRRAGRAPARIFLCCDQTNPRPLRGRGRGLAAWEFLQRRLGRAPGPPCQGRQSTWNPRGELSADAVKCARSRSFYPEGAWYGHRDPLRCSSGGSSRNAPDFRPNRRGVSHRGSPARAFLTTWPRPSCPVHLPAWIDCYCEMSGSASASAAARLDSP
mgnify:CR=1 FL=1